MPKGQIVPPQPSWRWEYGSDVRLQRNPDEPRRNQQAAGEFLALLTFRATSTKWKNERFAGFRMNNQLLRFGLECCEFVGSAAPGMQERASAWFPRKGTNRLFFHLVLGFEGSRNALHLD